MRRRAAALALLVALPAAAMQPLCEGGGIRVWADFHQAGLAGCTVRADGTVVARVEPEIRPINPSPWYAFRIEAPAGLAPVVTLRYGEGRHRYHPWVRSATGWARLDDARVRQEADGTAILQLPSSDGPQLVAAQPLDDPAAALAPFDARVEAGILRRVDGLYSLEARPVPMFLHWPERPRGLAVFVARQHPPEVPGAVAFDAFAAAMMADAEPFRSLRQKLAILWVPVLNPDGNARGHWRGNRLGADLNRDWGIFRQPETRGVGRIVEQLSAQLPLIAVMDFHATRRDVLYAPPEDPNAKDAGQLFATRLSAVSETADMPVSRSHTVNAGTLKGWSLDRFGISGLTWEVGDNTDLYVNVARARVAARLMATVVLDVLGPERED